MRGRGARLENDLLFISGRHGLAELAQRRLSRQVASNAWN